MLTAADILGADDCGKRQKVKVPEWGGEVFVKIMTGAERDQWELEATDLLANPKSANIRAFLCALTICDDKGARLFSDDQIAELGKKSSVALERIFQVAREINKVNDTDLEELEKNLEPAVRAVSGSS
jgi:hypothetical protein